MRRLVYSCVICALEQRSWVLFIEIDMICMMNVTVNQDELFSSVLRSLMFFILFSSSMQQKAMA